MNGTRPITEDEMLILLDHAFKSDPEQSLIWQLGQNLKDPLKPEDGNGRRRVHPLVLALTALAAIIIGSFVYFGVFHQ
jgi:hypothetical protein